MVEAGEEMLGTNQKTDRNRTSLDVFETQVRIIDLSDATRS